MTTQHRYPAWLRDVLYELAIEANVLLPTAGRPRPGIRPCAPRSSPSSPSGTSEPAPSLWNLAYAASVVAVVGGRVDLARGFVENALELAVPEGPDAGMIPRVSSADGAAGVDGSGPPLLAWLSWRLHELDPDEGFLSRIYPALAASVDWWQSPRRDVDGDGLSEYAGATPASAAQESGHPSSPERDLLLAGGPHPVGADGLVHEPIADVFLNASLFAELDALQRIAGPVDREGSPAWGRRRDQLRARMQELMWDEELGAFFPVVRADLCAARPRVHHHTPAMLQPLWAGLATQGQADRTVARLLETSRSYPSYDGILRVVPADDRCRGHQVVTDGLHPGADGVEVDDERIVLRFPPDSGPAVAPYSHLSLDVDVRDAEGPAGVTLTVVDGEGATSTSEQVTDTHGTATWTIQEARLGIHGDTFTRGLRSVEVTTSGGRAAELRLRYWRVDRKGLLARYGLKSAHPLDRRHPGPAAPPARWSGTVWGPHNFHACHGLRRYGHEGLARAVAMAYCDGAVAAYLSTGSTMEHHDAVTGRGYGAEGHTWGAGIALLLMEEFLDG